MTPVRRHVGAGSRGVKDAGGVIMIQWSSGAVRIAPKTSKPTRPKPLLFSQSRTAAMLPMIEEVRMPSSGARLWP
jgi:hypothetical protein